MFVFSNFTLYFINMHSNFVKIQFDCYFIHKIKLSSCDVERIQQNRVLHDKYFLQIYIILEVVMLRYVG